MSASSSQNLTSSSQNFTSSSQSTCPYQNFIESVQYAFSQLKMSHLKLKEEQEKVVRAIFEGKDVFVLLPTGFGKSVCFQVLPFVFDYKLGLVGGQKKSAVVVASPLIALIVDQVRSLRAHGVAAVIISSGAREGSLVDKEFLTTENNLKSASLIFSFPESLAHSRWREALETPVCVQSSLMGLTVYQSGKFDVN